MTTTENVTPRLKTRYREEIKAELNKEFDYANVMQIPGVVKVVVNMGVGDAARDAKLINGAVADLELNFLLLAASQQSDLGGHPRHSNGLPVVAHIELQFVGASNEFVLDLLGFCNSTTVHRL